MSRQILLSREVTDRAAPLIRSLLTRGRGFEGFFPKGVWGPSDRGIRPPHLSSRPRQGGSLLKDRGMDRRRGRGVDGGSDPGVWAFCRWEGGSAQGGAGGVGSPSRPVLGEPRRPPPSGCEPPAPDRVSR